MKVARRQDGWHASTYFLSRLLLTHTGACRAGFLLNPDQLIQAYDGADVVKALLLDHMKCVLEIFKGKLIIARDFTSIAGSAVIANQMHKEKVLIMLHWCYRRLCPSCPMWHGQRWAPLSPTAQSTRQILAISCWRQAPRQIVSSTQPHYPFRCPFACNNALIATANVLKRDLHLQQ